MLVLDLGQWSARGICISLPTVAGLPQRLARCFASALFVLFSPLGNKPAVTSTLCIWVLCSPRPVTESTDHIMDTAEEDEMRRALMQQGVLLGRHQEEIAASRRAYSEISLQLNQLVERFDQLHTSSPAAPVATPPPDPDGRSNSRAEPRLNPPASYSGEPNTCRSFLSQCSLIFSLQHPVFPRSDLKLLSPSRSWWGKLESGERPCGITSRTAVTLWQFLGGTTQGVWSLGSGNWGGTSLGAATTERGFSFQLFHRVSHARGVLWLERQGSLGSLSSRSGRTHQGWDLFPWITLEPGWAHRPRHPSR